MNLQTTYLGLTLKNPFMPGASPLADTVGSARALEDHGAAAIVLRSLFEEQILRERFRASAFAFGADTYLEHLRRVKARVGVPVIASINGTTTEGWLKYARLLQRAGADAIELNFYHVATEPAENAATVEARLLDIVAVLKESIAVPLAVKLSPFYSSLPNLAARLSVIGAQGLVIFNRFYQPDIDPDDLDAAPALRLSTPEDLLLRLRWLAILSPTFPGSLAVTGGIHGGHDAVKAVLAGADVVQVVSAMLTRGTAHLSEIISEFQQWGERHGYASVDDLRDRMNLAQTADRQGFERSGYLRTLQSWG